MSLSQFNENSIEVPSLSPSSSQSSNSSKYEYSITIDYNEYTTMVAQTTQHSQRSNLLKVQSKWIENIQNKMNRVENLSLVYLKPQNANIRKDDKPNAKAAHFSASAKCNLCHISYSFVIKDKPLNQPPFIVTVIVKRSGEHEHNVNKK